MKLFVVLLCTFVGLAAAGNTDIDWSTVRPIYEFQEWQDAHPGYMRLTNKADLMRQMQKVRFGPSGRIVGGVEADRHQFPYQVGLVIHLATGNGFCGGSLVSKNYVLTAAHCIDGPESMIAILGAHNVFDETESSQQRIFVPRENFNIYAGWNAENIHNDLAAARLPVEANYGNHIQSIRLPNRNQVGLTFVGEEAVASGWGRFSDRSQDLSEHLQFVRLPIITNLTCRTRFPNLITDDHVCAFGGLGGTCQGDNGGPLSIIEPDGRTTQIGVTSFGFGLSCELNWPSVYLRVTRYLDWIETNTDGTIQENW